MANYFRNENFKIFQVKKKRKLNIIREILGKRILII